MLLKRFLPHLEWNWPNEVREKVYREIFRFVDVSTNIELSLIIESLKLNRPVRIDNIAKVVSDSQIEKMIHISPFKDYYSFRGKYYTVRKNLKENLKDLMDQIDSLVIELFKEKIEDVISLERYIK